MKKSKLFKNIAERKLFVLDLDGVLYYGDTLIEGADKAVHAIRMAGRKIAFLTNNSGKRKETVHKKLESLGIACDVNEIYTSVDSAIRYLKKEQDLAKGVLMIGSADAKSQLKENGVILASSEECRCVLAGFKRDMSYDDVASAIKALCRDVPFIICNRDPYFPDKNGGIMPGCGYVVGAIEGSIGRRADVNVGKPETCMLEMLYETYNVSKDEIVVVGDTFDSDIEMAKRAGVPAIYIGSKVDCGADALAFSSLLAFTDAIF